MNVTNETKLPAMYANWAMKPETVKAIYNDAKDRMNTLSNLSQQLNVINSNSIPNMNPEKKTILQLREEHKLEQQRAEEASVKYNKNITVQVAKHWLIVESIKENEMYFRRIACSGEIISCHRILDYLTFKPSESLIPILDSDASIDEKYDAIMKDQKEQEVNINRK